MRHPCALLALVSLAACASGGGSSSSTQTTGSVGRVDSPSGTIDLLLRNLPNVVATRIEAMPDRVWAVLPAAFDDVGIPIGTVDPGQQLMGNAGVRVPRRIKAGRMTELLNCGNGPTGPNSDSYDVLIAALTRLEPDGSATVVRTVVDGRASAGTNGGAAVHCVSTGVLEQKLAAALTQRTSR